MVAKSPGVLINLKLMYELTSVAQSDARLAGY